MYIPGIHLYSDKHANTHTGTHAHTIVNIFTPMKTGEYAFSHLSTANMLFNNEKAEVLLLKSGTKKICPS